MKLRRHPLWQGNESRLVASALRGGAIKSVNDSLFFDAAPSAITGLLSATETADTFAASGLLSGASITGTLAATDGADSAAVSGSVRLSGSLSASESGADTFAASGLVRVAGSLASVESADSASATGSVRVSGALASTDGADSFLAVGAAPAGIDGYLLTDGESEDDTALFIGSVLVQGSFVSSESGADTALITGRTIAFVPSADRTSPAYPENRRSSILAENRRYAVPQESRQSNIIAENRGS